jgi:hypothetical protein
VNVKSDSEALTELKEAAVNALHTPRSLSYDEIWDTVSTFLDDAYTLGKNSERETP